MEIKRIIGGILMANCYIVSPSPAQGPCYIIDPGYDPHKIIQYVQKGGFKPKGILLTHHHVDHSGNAAYLRKELDCPIMIHREDADRFREGADVLLEDGDVLELTAAGTETAHGAETEGTGGRREKRGLKLKVLHTPGHTRGGICFLAEREHICFTGDTIFNVDLGRTDLDDGSYEEMVRSIMDVINNWGNDITIYPGHGDPATMKTVRKINLEFLEILEKYSN